MTRCRSNALATAVVAVMLPAAGCDGNATTSGSGSVTQTPVNPSRTIAAMWSCPPTPGDRSWPRSEHSLAGTMVPPGPELAVECTYRKDGIGPFAQFDKPITYTGLGLADLVRTFNTATKPRQMRCPAPLGVTYMSKFNFVYADGKSAIVSRTGYCPPVISNGTLTQQVTAPP